MEDYKDNDEEYYEKIMRMKITRLGKNWYKNKVGSRWAEHHPRNSNPHPLPDSHTVVEEEKGYMQTRILNKNVKLTPEVIMN